MSRPTRTLSRLLHAASQADILDRVADRLAPIIKAITPPGVITDLASGTPTGHPAHPPLATAAIGCVVGTAVIDLTGSDPHAARRLLGTGIIAALPTAYTGASDWTSTAGNERRIGVIHAATNTTALLFLAQSWWLRRHGRTTPAVITSLAGTAILGFGGWLGGHLAYALGVGVDTTAFQQLDIDWTDVAAESDIQHGTLTPARAGDVPVVLTRHADRIVALADRCTHRGAPLHEGDIVDGCIQCPWHGSRFRLDDGSVAAGPAVRPEPAFDTRVIAGRVEIRRTEEQNLRKKTVQ